MKSALALSVAACAAITSSAFTTPTTSRVNIATNTARFSQTSTLFANHNSNDEVEPIPSLKYMKQSSKRVSVRQRIKNVGRTAWERMDTMKAAGLYDNEDGLVPMQAGFKTNVGLLVGAFLFKWYRARFITKVCTT